MSVKTIENKGGNASLRQYAGGMQFRIVLKGDSHHE
jgi:hypothetical protein